eukprot:gene53319-28580_t
MDSSAVLHDDAYRESTMPAGDGAPLGVAPLVLSSLGSRRGAGAAHGERASPPTSPSRRGERASPTSPGRSPRAASSPARTPRVGDDAAALGEVAARAVAEAGEDTCLSVVRYVPDGWRPPTDAPGAVRHVAEWRDPTARPALAPGP